MLGNCKVGAIVFFVSDLARSLAFYRDILGLAVDAQDGDDGPWAMGRVGGLELVFISNPQARAGDTPVVVFSLDGGIDDHAEALAAKGVEIVTPVGEAPGGFSLDFVDPDRNVLSLYQDAALPRRR